MLYRLLAAACVVLLSCVPSEPDLEGRPCPCVTGYVCLADNTCTRFFDGGPDFDGGSDSGPDVGAMDAPMDVPMDVGQDIGADAQDEDAGNDAGPGDAGRDAQEPDSGVPDVGPPDVGVDAFDAGPPAPFCDRHGAGTYVCLDFDEDPPSPFAPFTSGSASIGYDSARNISGRAMRVSVAANEFAQFRGDEAGSADSGSMWFRIKIYVEDGPRIDYIPVFSVSQAFTPPYTYAVMTLSGGNGRVRSTLSRSGDIVDQDPTVPLPLDQWVCLELELPIGPSVQMISYLNGLEVGRSRVDSTGTWDRLHVGPDELSPSQARRTVWFDDFVWSRSRVGCAAE